MIQKMKVNTTEYRLGELFCGPGGIALGAKNARLKYNNNSYKIRSVWANDYDRDTCNTYVTNIGEGCKVICEDVRKVQYDSLEPIDGLAFGFPCNDFSIVGEQKGIDGKYGPLYTYGVNALMHFKPMWFLAENVGGLSNANEGEAFKTILKKLFDAGYNITPHLYKFEHYGVPQARHRIIIIGIKKELKLFYNVPLITTPAPISVREWFKMNPIKNGSPNGEFTKQSATVVERLKRIRPGQNAFTADLPKHLKLNVKGAQISQIYKRLDPDKPSYTITGSGGGGTHVYHWEEHRALTNRERATLQTFPNDYKFMGSKESVRKQIGMAVPPKGVEIIFNALLMTMAGKAYPFMAPSFEPLIHVNDGIKKYELLEELQLKLLENGIKYLIK